MEGGGHSVGTIMQRRGRGPVCDDGAILSLGIADISGFVLGFSDALGLKDGNILFDGRDVCVGSVMGAKLLLGSREVLGVNEGYSSMELGLSLMVGTGVNAG
mmetsp:Transcript_21090/g.31852  ORF Transcript_21090/g.31852 Transcript_21090/m.31852 type:complete len:102 (+) Transcript_21090:1350-1655(+)